MLKGGILLEPELGTHLIPSKRHLMLLSRSARGERYSAV